MLKIKTLLNYSASTSSFIFERQHFTARLTSRRLTRQNRLKARAVHRKVREMKVGGLLLCNTKIQSSKYLNNLIEPDHRNIKSRVNVMLDFKRLRNAAVVTAGVELIHRIRKEQFDLLLATKRAAALAVWNEGLSD